MSSGGTEAFPDLGRHCQLQECRQLDFLPFNCAGCRQVFCLEHRSYKAHSCPKSDHNSRIVLVCDICSASIETTGCGQGDQKSMLEKHHKSAECDPRKKKKPTCAVRRCKEILTFSNTCVCKTCHIKVCLNHRFPPDHQCNKVSPPVAANPRSSSSSRFLLAFASRSAKDCANNHNNNKHSSSSSPRATSSSIRAH